MNRKFAVEDKIRSLGAPCGKSFHHTVTATLTALENEDYLYHMMQLYAAVAQTCHTKSINIERNIRYLVKICWQRNPQGVIDLTGFDTNDFPKVNVFISALVGYVQREEDKERASLLNTPV